MDRRTLISAGTARHAVIIFTAIAVLMALPTAAFAGTGSVSAKGKNLKVRGESENLNSGDPGAIWRKNYIYIRIADAAAVATNNYKGFGPIDPDTGHATPIDVTGMYRIRDVWGGRLNPTGTGCINGMSVNEIDIPSVAYCPTAGITVISVKTGNGKDGVKLESLDPAGAVPATVGSKITTGNGSDGVLGGLGPDNINTGGGADGVLPEYEDTSSTSPEPEVVDGGFGNDKINLSSATGDEGGNQVAYGSDGNDLVISKGTYFDTLFGGDGDDVVRGGKGTDQIFGGAGDDYIKSGNGENYVYGDGGEDSITGGNESDELYGGAGVDVFSAGGGDDFIDASDDHSSDARVRCGGGFDTVYFDSFDGDPAAWKDCEGKTLH